MKYEVTLQLMIDPSVNDDTFDKTYVVDANNESDAYFKAANLQSNDIDEIKYKSIFDYTIKLIN